MDTLTATRTEQNVVHDWRFIEFVMETWTDPELADQYRRNPVETLARRGVCASAAPDVSTDGAVTVTVDDIDNPAPLTAAFTLCG